MLTYSNNCNPTKLEGFSTLTVLFSWLPYSKYNYFPRFWRTLGTYMTKLNPEDTKIHLIGNNVAGNKQGVKVKERKHRKIYAQQINRSVTREVLRLRTNPDDRWFWSNHPNLTPSSPVPCIKHSNPLQDSGVVPQLCNTMVYSFLRCISVLSG